MRSVGRTDSIRDARAETNISPDKTIGQDENDVILLKIDMRDLHIPC